MIIGITGPIGAGKSTVAKYLTTKGFSHYSVRAYLAEILHARNEPLSRAALVAVANELRQAEGSTYVMHEVLKNAKSENDLIVVESVRAQGDADAVRRAGGVILAVTSLAEVRYERLIARSGVTVPVTFAEFCKQDALEQQSSDPAKQSIDALVADADYVINNTRDQNSLHTEVDSVLKFMI